MKLEYYPETDSLYIDLANRLGAESCEVSEGIVLDYDAQGNLVGIDIDNASERCDFKEVILRGVFLRTVRKEENPMDSTIAAYHTSLADKPTLASVYDAVWHQGIDTRLRDCGQICYLPYAFRYQAPLLERLGMLHPCWQYRLEEGAGILLSKL